MDTIIISLVETNLWSNDSSCFRTSATLSGKVLKMFHVSIYKNPFSSTTNEVYSLWLYVTRAFYCTVLRKNSYFSI